MKNKKTNAQALVLLGFTKKVNLLYRCNFYNKLL